MFWLSTVRSTGQPHVAPLPAMWANHRLYFCTGAHEQKARNIEHDARCVLTTGTNDYRSGVDVVVEGVAQRVTATEELEQLSTIWLAKIDWRFDVGDGVFLDTTADGHPAIVFAVDPVEDPRVHQGALQPDPVRPVCARYVRSGRQASRPSMVMSSRRCGVHCARVSTQRCSRAASPSRSRISSPLGS